MFSIESIKKSFGNTPEDSRRISVLRAVVIGLAAGLSALALEFGAYWLSFFRVNACNVCPAWIVLPACGLFGGLISGFLVQKFSPTAYGSGIPQVRAYLLGAKVPLDFRLALVKLLAGSIALGSGLFMGREGPTVHVGAAVAAHLNKWFPGSEERRKQLIASGAGAGLAAAFNAPIAGVLFVAEELLKDISTNTIGTALLACFVASALTHIFKAPHMESTLAIQAMEMKFTVQDLFFWILLGVLSGVAGTLFNRGVLAFLKLYRSHLKFPVALRVGLAGLISGLVIAAFPADVHFRDYAGLRDLIAAGHELWYMVPVAFVAFFFLTLLAYGSGAPGGLFAPSIVLGSALGAMVSYLEFYLFHVGSPGTMAMIGMGAFFAAVARVPITAVVIVVEITKHYNLVPPLMVAVAISCYVASKMEKGSVYDMLREYSGLDEEIRRNQKTAAEPTALELMKAVSIKLSLESTEDELLRVLNEVPIDRVPVLDGDRLLGLIDLTKLLKASNLSLPAELNLSDYMQQSYKSVAPDARLSEIRALMTDEDRTVAVVDHEELKGLIHAEDLPATVPD